MFFGLSRGGGLFHAQFDDGPVALGWLRASHRELDQDKSTPWQPVHTHSREQKVAPGEIVLLEIEIWPSGTSFATGCFPLHTTTS